MEKEFFVNSNSHSPHLGFRPSSAEMEVQERLPNSFINLNWENSMNSMDQNVNFDSALSSFVSSPAASNSRGGGGAAESVVIRELIGRLGSICNSNDVSTTQQSHTFNYMGGGESNNSANTSCYSTPLNSPPKLNNLSMIGDHQMPTTTHPSLAPFQTDPGFAERAARLSCFGTRNLGGLMGLEVPGKMSRVCSSQSLQAANVQEMKDFNKFSRSSSPDNAEFANEDATINARKRKTAPRGKAAGGSSSSKDAKEMADDDKSSGKKTKSNETNAKAKVEPKQNPKPSPEPPKDYIHVRARRGQATDSHSLAERVRREKISERMKFLQDLVPGCNKVTGKALMLDEIINYVQSLQRQVEFLSMKLATVNPRLDFNMETSLTKDLLQSRESLSQAMYQLNSSVSAFQYGHHGEGPPLQQRDMSANNRTDTQCSINPLDTTTLHRNTRLELPALDGFGEAAAHFANFWEDDLQSVVQMGFGQNQSQETAFESQSFHGSLSTNNMKVEL